MFKQFQKNNCSREPSLTPPLSSFPSMEIISSYIFDKWNFFICFILTFCDLAFNDSSVMLRMFYTSKVDVIYTQLLVVRFDLVVFHIR